MRILFWSDGFWPRLGGIEKQSLEFILGMQKRGHQFVVVAQKDHADWKEEEIYQGIEIYRFDFNAILAKRELAIVNRIKNFVETSVRKFQPDIVHLNANVGGSLFAFHLLMSSFRAPVVATVYAPYPYENGLHPLLRKVFSSVHRVGCISQWVLEEIVKYIPEITSKCKLIYCGLPVPEIDPAPLSFSPPRLFSFGRLSPEKGFETAIRAFSLLKQRGSKAEFLLAGGGPERAALEKLAEDLQLGSSVQFLGVLAPEEVSKAYNRATLVIAPSLIESFGLVILEAMQMQRPVIASRIEGVPEVVAEGETGMLVPMKDPQALCEAMETLLSQPERALRMGIEGRKRAIERFTLLPYLIQYENLYRELTS